MSIGYKDMTAYDFDSYMNGSFTFQYSESAGKVFAYQHEGVARQYEDDDDSDATAFEAMLSPINNGPHRYQSVSTLVDSPEWILHRFPTGYVAVKDGAHLLRVALEPSSRRMRKGLDMGHMRGLPILDEVDPRIPESVRRTIGSSCVHYAGRYANVSDLDIVRGLCEQLWLGHTPAFRRVSIPDASKRSKDLIRTTLRTRNAVAIDQSTAVVRALGKEGRGYLLYNGQYMGRLLVEPDNTINLTCTALASTQRGVLRTKMREAYTQIFTKTVCDSITWRF